MTTEQVSPKSIEGRPAATVSSRGKLAYGLMGAGAGVLAATGIGTFALGKAPMSHWVLMAHVAVAPLFAIGLALVSLTWADGSRFGPAGWQQGILTKALLWLILMCGLVVILSGVVPMTPLFGTTGQHLLYLTHRYSAITLAAALVLHLLSLRTRR